MPLKSLLTHIAHRHQHSASDSPPSSPVNNPCADGLAPSSPDDLPFSLSSLTPTKSRTGISSKMDTPKDQRNTSLHIFVRPLTPRDLDIIIPALSPSAPISPERKAKIDSLLHQDSPTTLGLFTTPPLPADQDTPPRRISVGKAPEVEKMLGFILSHVEQEDDRHGGKGKAGLRCVVEEVWCDGEEGEGDELTQLKRTLVKSWVGRMRDGRVAQRIVVRRGCGEGRGEMGWDLGWADAGFMRIVEEDGTGEWELL